MYEMKRQESDDELSSDASFDNREEEKQPINYHEKNGKHTK